MTLRGENSRNVSEPGVNYVGVRAMLDKFPRVSIKVCRCAQEGATPVSYVPLLMALRMCFKMLCIEKPIPRRICSISREPSPAPASPSFILFFRRRDDNEDKRQVEKESHITLDSKISLLILYTRRREIL